MVSEFQTLLIQAFSYLSSEPLVVISIIAAFFLYFGYHSSRHYPFKNDKMYLYISGISFISYSLLIGVLSYVFFQNYLNPYDISFLFSIYILSISSLIILDIIPRKYCARLIFVLLILAVAYFSWGAYVKYVFTLPVYTIESIFIVLSFAYMISLSNTSKLKESLLLQSYDYDNFFDKVCKINLVDNIFILPIRLSQKILHTSIKVFGPILVSLDKTNKMKLNTANILLQKKILEVEVLFNASIIIILSLVAYKIITINPIVIATFYLFIFFSLSNICYEYGLIKHGIVLIELFPKKGRAFKCRLIEFTNDYVRVIRKRSDEKKTFNPILIISQSEISKIRYIGFIEMVEDEK